MDDILTTLTEWLQNFLTNFFGGNILYTLGINIWNWAIVLIGTVASTTPAQFSSEAWGFVTTDVLNFTMGIGATLLNSFYMVGMIRQSTNLKESFTLETAVDSIIKMLLGNMLILNGLDLMKTLFDIASSSSGYFMVLEPPTFEQKDIDAGLILFNYVFGIIFLIVSMVCAFTIFLTVYSRYLYLYLLIAVYPLAYSTLPGGQGVYNSASSFTRTFIAKTFEILVIAIAIGIAARMCQAIDFGSMDDELGKNFDGIIQTIQSMATMIILTASVKGTDTFMRRAFGL